MWKSGWMLVPLAALAVLGGCRRTACEDLAAVYAEVDQKARPCMERAPLPTFEPARCEQNLQHCDKEDVARLDSQVQCYQKLGTCTPEQKASFLQNITHCDSYTISNTCEAAIF